MFKVKLLSLTLFSFIVSFSGFGALSAMERGVVPAEVLMFRPQSTLKELIGWTSFETLSQMAGSLKEPFPPRVKNDCPGGVPLIDPNYRSTAQTPPHVQYIDQWPYNMVRCTFCLESYRSESPEELRKSMKQHLRAIHNE